MTYYYLWRIAPDKKQKSTIFYFSLLTKNKSSEAAHTLLFRTTGALMVPTPRPDSAFFASLTSLPRTSHCIIWPWWLHTSWSRWRVHSARRKTPAWQCQGGARIFRRQKKNVISPRHEKYASNLILWNIILGTGASCKKRKKKARGIYSVSNALAHCCLLQSLVEYSEGVSWWHFAMCSVEGEKAAEGSRIYWLNSTVINGSFTSDIKKMICSLLRWWRSVNPLCVLPAVMALVLNKVSFQRLQPCFW